MAEQVVGLRFVVEGGPEAVASIARVDKTQQSLIQTSRSLEGAIKRGSASFESAVKAYITLEKAGLSYSDVLSGLNQDLKMLGQTNQAYYNSLLGIESATKSAKDSARAMQEAFAEKANIEAANLKAAQSFGDLVREVNTYKTANKSAEDSASVFMAQIQRVEAANLSAAQSFGDLVREVNTYKTANKSAEDSAAVFSAELRKQESDFSKVAKANQEYLRSLQTINHANKSAADSASVFAKEIARQDAEVAAAAEKLVAEKLRLEAMYNKNAAASRVYQQAVSSLNRAVELGVIDDKQRIATLKQVEAAYEMAGKSSAHAQRFITQFGEGAAVAGVKTNRFGMYAQQVGYQVGDFFVQVQSGTDALVAFGQQGTQLAGLLPGLAGAIVGIGLSITTAFLNASLSAKKLTFDYKAFIADLADAVEPIALMLQPLATSFSAVGNVLATSFMFIAQNIDSVIVAAAGASTIFLGSLVPAILGAAKAVGVLTLALLKNPLFLGATVLAAVAVAFYQVVKAVGGLGQAIDAIGRVFSEVFSANNVGAVLGWFSAKFDETWYGLKATAIGVMIDIASYFAQPFDKMAKIAVGVVEGIKDVMAALPGIIGDAAKRGVNMAIDAFEKMAKAALTPINMLIKGANALGASIAEISVGGAFANMKLSVGNSGANLGAAFSAGFARGSNITSISAPILASLAQAENSARSAAAAAGTAAGNALSRMNRSATLDSIIASIVNQTGPFSGNYLTPDNKGGAGGASDDPLDKLLEEMQARKRLIGLRGEELTLQKAIDEVEGKIGEKYKDPALIEALAKRLVILQQQEEADKRVLESQQQLADIVQSSMSDAFMSIVDGTKTAASAFKDMARLIIAELYKVLVVQRIVGSFQRSTGVGTGIVGFLGGLFSADGNVFNHGAHVTAYANGGVVNGPTVFPMTGGNRIGLMGEAGPEAIMPLKRTRGGKLGVVAEGGGGNVNQTLVFNISANGDESVKRIVQQEAPRIAEQAKAAVLDAKRRGGSYGSKF